MPKVSVCIPTYNNASEVEHLLQTLYEQEYTDYEVNISDDSANNEIENLVDEYNKIYINQKIRYVHNKKGHGHIFNWNAAIKMSSEDSEYIKIMFSDDWFTDKNSLGEFVCLLDKNPKASMAFSGSRQVMLDGQMVKHITKEHSVSSYDRHADKAFIDNLKMDYRYLFLGNQIGAPSAVIYRRGKSIALFDEKSNWASDMFLYFDILKQSAEFEYTTKPLISIGVHQNQYTEGFAEKDIRIYNDYKYLYTKYNLHKCEACREYFAEKFIVKYHKGVNEAKELGITDKLYWNKWFENQKETLKCFINSHIKHFNKR